jgi:plastocyanin
MRVVLGLVIGTLFFWALPSRAATLSGTVTISGTQAAGAIVYLESAEHHAPQPTAAHAVMDQSNLHFVPRVLPVVRGTVVMFTNSDNVLHNVFSPSATVGKFDLGSYSQGEARSVTLNEPGDVLILCNIHMEMEAHILVLKDPYFAAVAADGSFQIPEVPSGTYTLRIWHERLLSYTQTLDVPATGTLTVALRAEK